MMCYWLLKTSCHFFLTTAKPSDCVQNYLCSNIKKPFLIYFEGSWPIDTWDEISVASGMHALYEVPTPRDISRLDHCYRPVTKSHDFNKNKLITASATGPAVTSRLESWLPSRKYSKIMITIIFSLSCQLVILPRHVPWRCCCSPWWCVLNFDVVAQHYITINFIYMKWNKMP